MVRARQKIAEEADRADQPAVPAEAPPLQFATLPAFVAYLGDLYRREVFDSSERVWCPKWWEHPEAIARLEVMWRALEALRQHPATGISAWSRDHADVHMARLMQPHGPFRGCTATRGHSIGTPQTAPAGRTPR